MKNIYWKNFLNLRLELRVILYISLGIIILVDLIFANVPEKLPVGYNIGVILTKLSYSYISALVFYFLVVHYKRQDEKRKYYKVLFGKLTIFITEYKRIFQAIYGTDDIPTTKNFDEEILKNKLSAIKTFSIFPGAQFAGIGATNWIVHILAVKSIYKKESDLIFQSSTFIDVELVAILNEINSNELFHYFELFTISGGLNNENLGDFYKWFSDYMTKTDLLITYIDTEVKKYL